jgi:hypothetical protein
MPPFRNPFNRRPPALNSIGATDENTPPNNGQLKSPNASGLNSRTSSSLSIKRNKEPDEFKLSGKLHKRSQRANIDSHSCQ